MTAEEREQWGNDGESIIIIPTMMDLPCGQIEGIAPDKWVRCYLQKAV